MTENFINIRDALYGGIRVSAAETACLEHPFMQRLRRVKQLGFAEYVYPGATHTRHLHSIGAMEIATRIFDGIFPKEGASLPLKDRERFRRAVRLAALLHDVGHAPRSHVSESAFPQKRLVVPSQPAENNEADEAKTATHEDYTAAILLNTDMRDLIRSRFESGGVIPEDVVSLLTGRDVSGAGRFVVDGENYLPILHQIISSEMDCDRMDYLLRDAFFCGVAYGKYDQDWLINNLIPARIDGCVYLGLEKKAVFSFEDFLLSRYHMFVTVYLHYRVRGLDKMLALFFDETGFKYPSDPQKYCELDDVELHNIIKKSDSFWARQITQNRILHRIFERNSYDKSSKSQNAKEARKRLSNAGVRVFEDRTKSVLSRYYTVKNSVHTPLYVNAGRDEYIRIENYSPLFDRFAKPLEFLRYYVLPEERESAERALL